MSFPINILIKKELDKKNELQLNIGLGIKKTYLDTASYSVGYVDKNNNTVTISNVSASFKSQFLPNPLAEIGFIHTFKNGFKIGTSIKYNYSTTRIMTGEYSILTNTPDYSTGQIKSNLSYFSFSIKIGGFTNRRLYKYLYDRYQ